jgi:hypothetical protein
MVARASAIAAPRPPDRGGRGSTATAIAVRWLIALSRGAACAAESSTSASKNSKRAPLANATPAASAVPLPRFLGNVMIRSAPARSATAEVSSREPSSTTMISDTPGIVLAARTVRPIVALARKAGIITETDIRSFGRETRDIGDESVGSVLDTEVSIGTRQRQHD